MFMATTSTGNKNGRASFDFFRFLRVDTQNLCWADESETNPVKLEVGG